MTSVDEPVALIAHAIQLAVAPVFLLTGVGALLSVMANRLGRVIDRARLIEGALRGMDERARRMAEIDLKYLARRARYASWAINCCALAALLVCSVIAILFMGAFLGTDVTWAVGAVFVACMLALIGGLLAFLREVYDATQMLRIGPAEGR